ncbi:MAG: YeeE/YedE thiosulfate transporter family protein [Vibrio sp.]
MRLNPANRVIWRDLLILGLMASIIFLYEPRWTPSGLLKDMGLSLWAEHMADWPSLNRFILMFCLMGGMLISTLKTGTFSLTFYSFSRYLFHLSAGILMGIGAVLAGGGNDSQLLIALPSLSPAGFSTIFSIIFGIYLGKRLIQFILSRRKRMLPE